MESRKKSFKVKLTDEKKCSLEKRIYNVCNVYEFVRNPLFKIFRTSTSFLCRDLKL